MARLIRLRPRLQLPRQAFWLVSATAALQTFLQAFDAALQGSLARFVLWLAGSLVVGPLAAWAENSKAGAKQ